MKTAKSVFIYLLHFGTETAATLCEPINTMNDVMNASMKKKKLKKKLHFGLVMG